MDCVRVGQAINNAIKKHPWLWHPYNFVYNCFYWIPCIGNYMETVDTFRDPDILRQLEESQRDIVNSRCWRIDFENNRFIPSLKLQEEGE
ncbi:MAG: hypothetical protein KAU03_03545, partial [Candidatus Altiarchaeales archaeon]|nr:hypothetical protein [Candidatus Altiarchaeales archaeon]